MHIFKFGGASINTAKAVRNIFEIVCDVNLNPLVVIVSAMGKSTNALEEILNNKLAGSDYSRNLKFFEKYHHDICKELFEENDIEFYSALSKYFGLLKEALNRIDKNKYDWSYDQVVSFGELISAFIISGFLKKEGLKCFLLNAPDVIKTNSEFREAQVDWTNTSNGINFKVEKSLDYDLIMSQGFIGSDAIGNITTLGREGSDFTAAIFASSLDAESVTVWKDVPGIMSGDPKLIKDAVLIDELSYQEASEMTYYGAKVIHPKTIRPLTEKNIPLYVKNFDHPGEPGTCIHDCKTDRNLPVIIYKKDQSLFSFRFTDFNFVNEKSLIEIHNVLDQLNIKVNMMQNSAISFSVCIDHHEEKNVQLIKILREKFELHYNMGLTLITIKNYTDEALEKYKPKGHILLEQKSRANYQAVFK